MTKVLNSDNWYLKFPEKILGEAYETSGRFKEKVTKYKGSLSDLDKINTPDYIVMDMLSPYVSSIHTEIKTETELDERQKSNIRKALGKSDNEKKARASAQKGELDLITFEEIDERYNSHISKEEKQVFVWWMKMYRGYDMEGGWKKYKSDNWTTKNVVPMEWVRKGYVFYYKDGYLPRFIYLSGNIFNRYDQLAIDEQHIKRHKGGEAIFERQRKSLEEKWNEVLSKMKKLDAEDLEDRLIIKPISDLANEFTIEKLRGDIEFTAKRKRNGNIDFYKDLSNQWNKDDIKSLSLKQAFVIWLSNNSSTIGIKRGLTWRDITELYFDKKKYNEKTDGSRVDFRRKQAVAQEEAIRLFSDFLAKEITNEDREKLEKLWNKRYNSELSIDLDQVPIGFSMARYYNGMEMDIRKEKREAIAFAMIKGSCCINYGVGLGKTWCAIFTLAQFIENGWCKRPFLVLPNQVYPQFKKECSGILPHVPQNDFFNLSKKYLNGATREVIEYIDNEDVRYQKESLETDDDGYYYEYDGFQKRVEEKVVAKANKINENSISFLTYEGFKRIGISNQMESAFFEDLYEILEDDDKKPADGSSKKASKAREAFNQKISGIVGEALKGTILDIQDLGLDFMILDEAHSAKKLFSTIKADVETKLKDNKEKNIRRYDITSGQPSLMARKVFMISRYIQYTYPTKNVMLLTATPFTNSPMEVFSMTSIINYDYLKEKGFRNLKKFFDHFAKTSLEMVFSVALKPEFKSIFTGFYNISALQEILRECYLKKDGKKSANLKRPNKIVLPFNKKIINGKKIELGEYERLETVIPFLPNQKEWLDNILSYAQGDVKSISQICETKHIASDDETTGVRLLMSSSLARNLAISPYLLNCDKDTTIPDNYSINDWYLKFVESSAKLRYTVECIKTVKEWHEERKEPVSGQIIYSNKGVKYFPLIREYLIKVIGFKPHEVGIIVSESRMKSMGFVDKSTVQNRFLGRRFNLITEEYVNIPHSERCKILIGSATIREGINLQYYSTVLFNLDLPWNPTDVNQLEGRLWRQGNIHKNVRIVNPLMEDSMDIFMFQKLDEKTQRINALWNFDGHTQTLDTRDFDPKDLKYILIKDPYRIAQIDAREKSSTLEDEISVLKAQVNIIDQFNTIKAAVDRDKPRLLEFTSKWFGKEETEGKNIIELDALMSRIKRQSKLPDGRSIADMVKKLKAENRYSYGYSSYGSSSLASEMREYGIWTAGYSHPYFYTNFKKNLKVYQKTKKYTLEPRGLKENPEDLKKAKEILEKEMEVIKEKKEGLFSEENINIEANKIMERRKKDRIIPSSIEQRVKEFAQLNYLLGERRIDYKLAEKNEAIIKAIYVKGDSIKYKNRKAKITKVIERKGEIPLYWIEYGKFKEIVLEGELEPTNAKQRNRLKHLKPQNKNTKSAKAKLILAKAKMRLAKARIAMELAQ